MNNDEKATRSEFLLTLRNIPILSVATAVVAWVVSEFGTFGKVIGVLHVLLLGVFGWQALISTGLAVAVLARYPFRSTEVKKSFQPSWISLGILITAFDVAAYGVGIYLIGRIARWWN